MLLPTVMLLFSLSTGGSTAQEISRSFEFRYVTDDVKADGETDFKGETAVFDTDGRIEFLRRYGAYARDYFDDPGLDTEVVTDGDADRFLAEMKPQPLPSVRKRIRLSNLAWLGYTDGLREKEEAELTAWRTDGAVIENGAFTVTGKRAAVTLPVDGLTWRFKLSWTVTVPDGADASVSLAGEKEALRVAFGESGRISFTDGGGVSETTIPHPGARHSCLLEVDLSNNRYNFSVDGELLADFVPLAAADIDSVGTIRFEGGAGVGIDDVLCTAFSPTGEVRTPYSWTTIIDEDFRLPPGIDGWQRPGYDDSAWERCDLPKGHGGERFAGQGLYLRKTVAVGVFDRAVLDIETLDPGGEVWVNGVAAAVIDNRRPARIDITGLLVPDSDNLIAVKVDPFFSEHPMGHAPLDRHIGWFAGRMSLDLTSRTWIDDVFAYTLHTSDPASVAVRIRYRNETDSPFAGAAVVKWRRWFPEEEGRPAFEARIPVRLRAWGDITGEHVLSIPSPAIWTCDDPNLYHVQVVLEDENGDRVDDFVFTTGIRTVGQEGGTFRLNGAPDMLNGAQIMGFRVPVEKSAAWNRCPPPRWLAKEMMQVKRMNGNLMRVHVHAWHGSDGNVNDPRIPEICDQLGLMLIWGTTAWIRSGEAFAVDFEGYPHYMRQVYNHPSIVMWEVSNHPNRFKKYDISESDDFCEAAYAAIAPVDMSRLISFTSFIGHLHYGNDPGTVDYRGNPIRAAAAWTADRVTRGNQDSITGYGKEWTLLRNWPTPYHRNFLDSRSRAYFNFEHEESIGQPNWTLAGGKPWYRLQSYEWGYDEGSIGRRLTADEWLESQAWQAFSAWEAMKKQRILDYDGFSWCCLHGGANSGTYKKPLIDCYGRAKLAFHTNAMAFQRVLAGSGDVDTVYGPGDRIAPVILNLDGEKLVDLVVDIRNDGGETVDSRTFTGIRLPAGRTVTALDPFRPSFPSPGYYAIEYRVLRKR